MNNHTQANSHTDSSQKPNRRGGMGRRGGGFVGQKAKNSRRALITLSKYFGKLIPLIILAFILAIASAIVTILTPRMSGDMMELLAQGLLSGNIDIAAIGKIGLKLGIMITSTGISFYLQGLLMTEVTQRTGRRFRTDINKNKPPPLEYFDKHSFGDVLSRVTNDVDMIGTSVNQSAVSFIWSSTLLIGLTGNV